MDESAHDRANISGRKLVPSPLAALPRRDTILILASIALVTALAWLYLIHLDRQMTSAMSEDAMMAAMGMSMNTPWTAADLFSRSRCGP